MQPVDFTTLTAACSNLRSQWLPARLEQVYQRDRYTLHLALRTLNQRGWLTICWHPQAARLCMGAAPPRTADTFTFSQQLRHQLNGLALVALAPISAWERVIDLQFSRRPQDPPQWHLYVEIMGKYSNVILTNADQLIVTAAHQVSAKQSRVRPIQTGQIYDPPPRLTTLAPSLTESQAHWQAQLTLIPAPLKRTLLQVYRGLSSALALSMIEAAGLEPEQQTDHLTPSEWNRLFHYWQTWLTHLDQQQFTPGWRSQGYTVLGWGTVEPAPDIHSLLDQYYCEQLNRQAFQQLQHQLQQKLVGTLAKLQTKAQTFETQLNASDMAEDCRHRADLLMAHLQDWQPGMTTISLPDFVTGESQSIPLNPEKTAIQNAQALYKRHQKLKRSRQHVTPLLDAVHQEIQYLEQVDTTIQQLALEQDPDAFPTLIEIREELIQQAYLHPPAHRSTAPEKTQFHRYQTPSGWELLIGRNNRQNDQLTFRLANAYDLWFHTQEIPGSHVLLRLEPGAVPDTKDLQYTANLAAYYSRARQSYQVPVVYTKPKHVFKPKGAKPGMVIYQREQVLWGEPQAAIHALTTDTV